jgi:hypothetical protein
VRDGTCATGKLVEPTCLTVALSPLQIELLLKQQMNMYAELVRKDEHRTSESSEVGDDVPAGPWQAASCDLLRTSDTISCASVGYVPVAAAPAAMAAGARGGNPLPTLHSAGEFFVASSGVGVGNVQGNVGPDSRKRKLDDSICRTLVESDGMVGITSRDHTMVSPSKQSRLSLSIPGLNISGDGKGNEWYM